jgi:antitoxin (DNA-binding transcriptional repressor) of toxin-antitoxin stability system
VRHRGAVEEHVVLERRVGADVDAAQREAPAERRAEAGEELGKPRAGRHVQRLVAVRASPQRGLALFTALLRVLCVKTRFTVDDSQYMVHAMYQSDTREKSGQG